MNKNIKTLLLHLIILFSIGCNLSSSGNSSFTGNWRLIKSNGTHFNVPPKVKLNEINRTVNSKQSKKTSTLSSDKIVFAYDSLNYFSETEFYYNIFYKNEVEFLELISIDKKKDISYLKT